MYLSILKMILENLTKIFYWCKNHVRLTFEIALIISLVFAGYLYNKKQDEVNKTKQEMGQLAEGLHQQIVFQNNQIQILTKQGSKIIYKNVYVPPEGSVTIQQKELDILRKEYAALIKRLQEATSPEARAAIEKEIKDKLAQETGGENTIVVKDKGFAWPPRAGMGLSWANKGIKLRGDVKIFYFQRWSVIAGGSANGFDAGISRHIDDLLIWFHPENVEIFGAYNYLRFNNAAQGSLGLRVNL